MRSDWLESFLVFSDCLNFTHAAEKLYISQPALHVKIKKLSDYIGSPLYHKQGRHLILTKEGQMIQRFAREMQQRSNSFLSNIREGAEKEPVILAAGEGTYLYLLGPAIKYFLKTSDIPISLVNTGGESIVASLLSGQSHVGVSAIQTVPDAITTTDLTTVDQVVVLPKTHPLAKKRAVKLTDLANEPMILPPKSRPHRATIEQAFISNGLPINVAIEAGGWEVTLHFVKLGMGISIVNSCCKIPSTLKTFKLAELPKLTYKILELQNAWYKNSIDELRSSLIKHAHQWKK